MKLTRKKFKIRNLWTMLGPGFVTGAADDDPSGVVTYSQAGAKYGFGQLWTAILMLPFLVAVQEMCARIGMVTGKGLAKNIKEHYPRWVLFGAVALLFLANTINIGADIGAMAAATRLFVHVPFTLIAIVFFVIILSLEIFIPYRKYARILKWLTLTLLAYIVTGIIVGHGWKQLLTATFLPHIVFTPAFFILLTGVLGTTISPYMFFWEAQQEIEEDHDHHVRGSESRIKAMRIDTWIGMIFSEVGSWFIIMTSALVLNANGVFNITSAQQAAQALQPLVKTFPHSGTISELLFAIGIVGAGLLAVPIFAATSAYAVAELAEWHEGLAKKFDKAKGFYIIIVLGTLIGLLLNFLGVNPISALVYTAVLNGIIAPVIIFLLVRLANDKRVMGDQTNGFWSNLFVWGTFVGMAAAIFFSAYQLWK